MKNLLLLFLIMLSTWAFSQTNPVKFTAYAQNDTLIFEATIEKGWHLYAAHLPNPYEGPLPTELIFDANSNFHLDGKVIEPIGIVEMDDAFGIEVKYFKNSTIFKQPITRITKSSFTCSGTINYMVCNDQMCIPLDYSFTITLK
jgi:DsbC/DsbD-like thiol-disulfide interchange protein